MSTFIFVIIIAIIILLYYYNCYNNIYYYYYCYSYKYCYYCYSEMNVVCSGSREIRRIRYAALRSSGLGV